jgi:hypothetical protein
VALLHQEADGVLLVGDRVGFGARDDLHGLHLQLVAAGAARVGGHLAVDHQRALLRQAVQLREERVGDGALGQHALDRAAAVADLEELQLAGAAAVGEPAAHAHDLPDVLAELPDARDRRMRCVSHRVMIRYGRAPVQARRARGAPE